MKKMMKKWIAILLVAAMALSSTGCVGVYLAMELADRVENGEDGRLALEEPACTETPILAVPDGQVSQSPAFARQEINFSDPYIDSNLGVVTKADSTETTKEALNVSGKKIAAQAGTTGEAWAQENLSNATVVSLDDPVQALTGVQTGLYDAACADLPVVKYLCTTSYTDLSVAIEVPTGDQYGMAVSKGNQALLDAVNEALQAVIDSGKRDEIETKWFGSTL